MAQSLMKIVQFHTNKHSLLVHGEMFSNILLPRIRRVQEKKEENIKKKEFKRMENERIQNYKIKTNIISIKSMNTVMFLFFA